MDATPFLGSAAILAILALAYIAVKFNNFKLSTQKRDDCDDESSAEDIEVKAERRFFRKYANINPKVRTVTLTQAIIQARKLADYINENELRAIIESEEIGGSKGIKVKNAEIEGKLEGSELLVKAVPSVSKVILRAAKIEAGFGIDQECPSEGIDLVELGQIDEKYNTYNDKLSIHLGRLCPCPGKEEGFCYWEKEMLMNFMVDTEYYDLISIRIIDCKTNSVLSASTVESLKFAPSGNYVIVTMSNPSDLQNLKPGQQIKIEFRWMKLVKGKNVEQCIILRNIIPPFDSNSTSIAGSVPKGNTAKV